MARRGKNGHADGANGAEGHADGEQPEISSDKGSAALHEQLDLLPDIIARIDSAKQRIDDARSELGNIYQDAEGRGFDRRALRDTWRLHNMESGKRNDYLRRCNAYGEKLGLFAQGDLFGEEPRPPQPEPPPLVDADHVAAAGARSLGWQDGRKGDRHAAHLYGQGTPYHADYELGWQEGQRQLLETQMGPVDDRGLAEERDEDIKDPFAAGKKAALHGLTESRNPFDLGKKDSAEWIRGYEEGKRELLAVPGGRSRRRAKEPRAEA